MQSTDPADSVWLHPRERAGNGSVHRWLQIAAAGLAASGMGLLILLLLGWTSDMAGLLTGVVMALLPAPVYVLLALWLDRYEKEPLWMLTATFIWGATAAYLIAWVLNTVFSIAMTLMVDESLGTLAAVVLSAPVVEEAGKGIALLFFYLWKKDEFDNILDGIIYASMVGLGFATTENIQYYSQAHFTGGAEASILTFLMRGVISPYAHPLFASMFGIGLGVARISRTGSTLKVLAPWAGICLAMILHSLWNLSASFGEYFFAAYILIMVPVFVGVLVLVFLSLRREGRILREFLTLEVQNGLLDEQSFEMLCSVSGRMRATFLAMTSRGFHGWRARSQFHDVSSELAFHRWRTGRGIIPAGTSPEAREAAYLQRLEELKSRLD